MNILFTSSGRRNYLIQYFKVSRKDIKVFAVDSSEYAPSLSEADFSEVVKQFNHEDYVNDLLTFCKKNEIKLLIPLNDLEILILSDHIDSFKKIGTFPLLSNKNINLTCFDKYKTYLFLKENDFDHLKTFICLEKALKAVRDGDIAFPLILKPRWGTASIGIEIVESKEELEITYSYLVTKIKKTILKGIDDISGQDILIQEFAQGEEFGLDIINDLNGVYQTTFCKKKIRMRSGETDCAQIVGNKKLQDIGHKLSNKFNHIGIIDCDVIEYRSKLYIIDLNPRFGGGYPFSHEAGATFVSALINWVCGENDIHNWDSIRVGEIYSKRDQLISINTNHNE